MEKRVVGSRKEEVIPTGIGYRIDDLEGHIRRHGILEKWNDGIME